MSQHVFFPNSCPTCGSQLQYGSRKRELRCKKCGYKRELKRNSSQVSERKLNSSVDFSRFTKGMGEITQVKSCGNCSSLIAYHPNAVPGRCPVCNQNEFTDVKNSPKTLEPKNILPFTVPEHRARKILRRHLRKRRPWMLPAKIFKTYRPEQLRAAYIPAYLMDVYVRASWEGKGGFRIPVNNKGKVTEKEVWEPVTGYYENFYENQFTLASPKIDKSVFDQINDFPLRDLVAFDPGYLESFPAEVTEKDPNDSVKDAEKSIDDAVKSQAQSKIKAEKTKDLKITSDKEALTWQHVLLPVWISSFTYRKKTFQYLINGKTGKVAGDKPLSLPRILILIGTITVLLVLLVWWSVL